MISIYDSLIRRIANDRGIGCCPDMELEEISIDEGQFRCLSCQSNVRLGAEWELPEVSQPKKTSCVTSLSEIDILEKSLNARVVKVLRAEKNGGNGYNTEVLLAGIKTGDVSTMETSLTLESLQQLGSTPWSPKAKAKFEAQQAKISVSHITPSWEEVSERMITENPTANTLGEEIRDAKHSVSSLDNPLDFILAGKAFTVENEKSGNRFTFKVRKLEGGGDDNPHGTPHFVSVLTNGDNETGFEYLGTIWQGKSYFPGKKSRISIDAPSQKTFVWLWNKLKTGKLPAVVKIYHEGR